jgi:hypothetical protein
MSEAFKVSRERMVELLNEDLSREYQINRTQSSDWVIAQPKAGCRIKGRLG